MVDVDYYKVLQLDPGAEPEIVRVVYHRLSQKYHPDGTNPNPEKMRQINDAHEVIGDPGRRKRYDSHRQYGWDPLQKSESARPPSYWNPPQSVYNPATRAPRRRNRAPISGPLGVFGVLMILAFLAIVLQSGFSVVQRAATSALITPTARPTPAPVFPLSAEAVKQDLLATGFAFTNTGSANDSLAAHHAESKTDATISKQGTFISSIEISIAKNEGTDERLMTPDRQRAMSSIFSALQVSDPSSDFLVDWIDFWTDYQLDGTNLQIENVAVELSSSADTIRVIVRPVW